MNLPPSSNVHGGTLRLLLGIIFVLLLPIFVWASASGPAWWITRGVQNTNSANDYAAVNQGQLKNTATAAVSELNANLPGGAGDTLDALTVQLSATSAQTNDYAAVNLGQLKTVAKPFYDRLIAVGYTTSSPWATSTNAANDYAMSNIGQVKNLFSFDVTFDGDVPENGLPDWWEKHWFNGQTGINRDALAPRGDGITNLQSYSLGLNPLDQYNSVVNPVKPTITLSASPSVTTAPGTIVLTATATQVSGTVARIDFYQDWGYWGSVVPSSGSATLVGYATIPDLNAGVYAMNAVAVDSAGICSSATTITVTVNPASATTDPNRYSRGWGTDQNLLSSVIALDFQKGVLLEGDNATSFPDTGLPWFMRTAPEPGLLPWKHITSVVDAVAIYNYPFGTPKVVGSGTVGGIPPLVAFGNQGGGSPLYTNQNYSFGVVAGYPFWSGTNDLMIEVYEKTALNDNASNVAPIASGTFFYTLPKTNTDAWNAFAQNGYVMDLAPISGTFNGKTFNLSTKVQFVSGETSNETWGQRTAWPLVLTHKSTSTDFVYKVNYKGVTTVLANLGLRGEYFADGTLNNLVYSRTDPMIDFSWSGSPGTLVPADYFSVRWTGLVLPKYTGTYTFYVTCDDGACLWVNGKQITNQWTYNGGVETSGTIALTAGQKYDIRLAFNEVTGPAYCHLSWSCGSLQPKEIIPQSQLYSYQAADMACESDYKKKVYNLTYSLDFNTPPSGISTYITQPHFEGIPLPSAYQGKTLEELIHSAPAVTDTLPVPSGTNYITVDNSPELRNNPVLDQFVSNMGGDPMAIANYVLNEIELTDSMGYATTSGTNVQTTSASINPTGVSRSALATYMEGQGSPAEQCALLVYMLRKCTDPATGQSVPCGYVFPQQDGTLMFDQQLSKLLRMQIRGASTDVNGNSDAPQLIKVNYPWVAAYIGGKWVHIFPWLKDTAVEEGYDLKDYLPTGYQTAGQWARKYLLNDSTIRSLSKEDDNPGILYPLWVKKQLDTNYPGMSVDDFGIKFFNRRNYYFQWEDFPRPWQTPTISGSNLVQNLSSITNIFDTVSVNLYKNLGTGAVVDGQTPILTTGTMRLVDLHNRRFLLYHKVVTSGSLTAYLTLDALRPSESGTGNFTNDADLLKKQVVSYAFASSDDYLLLKIDYQRHRQLPSNFVVPDFWTPFLGFTEGLIDSDTRPLRKGDMAAICLSYGRATQKMQDFHAQKYWNYQTLLSGTSAPSVADPELATGELLYLMGQSYYYKVSQFQESLEQWTKTRAVTWTAHGLSKLSPERNTDGSFAYLTGSNNALDLNLRYPNVDMMFVKVAWAGNGTAHLDSGDAGETGADAMQLLICEGSAEEHRVINQFFQQDSAVSTVKLLDLAVAAGKSIVKLGSSNYMTSGTAVYTIGSTSKSLADWAGTSTWDKVTGLLSDPTNGPLTTVYMTPGAIVAEAQLGKAYTGMGTMILGIDQDAALISSNITLNGGYGGSTYFDIPSFNLSNYYVTHTLLTPTYNFGYSIISTLQSSINTQIYTPPIYSNSSISTINYAVSTSSMSYFQDYSLTLWDYAYNTGRSSSMSYSVSNTGYSAAAMSTAYLDTGYAGQTSNNRNLTFSLGASSNGSFASSSGIADPVNVINGEFYVDAVDLRLDGPMPLEIRRNYGSLNKSSNNFGYGWRMGCFPYLVLSDTAASHPKITTAEMDGSVISYSWDAGENAWKPTAEENPHLANVAQGTPGGLGNVFNNRITLSGTTTYTLKGADGSNRVFTVRSFDADGSGLTRTRPYLQSWTDNRGNSYSFTFGTDSNSGDYGQVSRIQASNGNFVGFYYDIYGHITEAYTGDGRRLYYNYDNFGDLIQVTLPDASTLNYDYQHLPVSGSGLTATYFSDETLTTKVLTRTEPAVDFNWGSGSPDSSVPGDHFSARWTGLVVPKYTGTYTFYVSCDDGAYLWVNGKLIIDHWGYNQNNTTEPSGTITLTAGQKYDIRLAYHEATSPAYCKLSWSCGSQQAKVIIPQSQLFPTTNPASTYSAHLLVQETKPGGRILQNDYDSTGRVVVQRSTSGTNDALVTTGSFSYSNSTNATLTNGSFETPLLASGTFQAPSSGAQWTFEGSAYIQSNGSTWNAASAPDGRQTAVLQGKTGNTLGGISQAVYFSVAGQYKLVFQAAQRANYGVQPIKVSLDGVQVGSLISPTGTSFSEYQSTTFAVTSGTHTLKFSATENTADKDSFIDGVSLVSANSGITGTTTFIDARNNTTTYTYANSQITRVDDPSGYPVIQEWYSQDDANGGYRRSLKKRTDKRGMVTEYQYDARGNLKEMSVTGNLTGGSSNSEAATTFMEYNSRNLLTSSTDAVGNVTSYIYGTDTGRLYLPASIQKSAPGGIISTTALDYEDVGSGSTAAYGLLKQETVAAGTTDQAQTIYTHNANGFVSSATKPTGTSDPAVVVHYRYNLRGELVAETDELGRTKNHAYDGRGNRIWTEWHDEDGTLASWQYNYYNQNGEIEWTQGPRYNPDDYVLKRYDAAGRLSEETKWRSEANTANTGVQAPDDLAAAYATAFYFYDATGNTTEIRDVRQNSTEMIYDAIGQMTTRKFHEGGLTGTVKAQESFGYEPGGQVTTYVSPISGTTTKFYTSTGKPKEQDNPDGSKLYWQYDLSGRVVKETLRNGNYWLTQYDDYARTVTRTLYSGSGNQPITSGSRNVSEIIKLDRRGNLVSKTDLEGNTFVSNYDCVNRVKATAGPATNSTTAQETTYHTYGAGGKVHIIADALMQSTYTLSDTLGRPLLVQVKDRANKVVRQSSYVYSPDFNKVTVTEGIGKDAISSVTFTDTYGKPVVEINGNGYTRRYDYDQAGNLLRSKDESNFVTVNTCDALNRLATQTLPGGAATTFIYDAAGNLRQRQMPGNQIFWQEFDSASRKTKEYLVGSNGATSGTTRIFNYGYYSSGEAWPGMPKTTSDPRGVTFTTTYDNLLRPAVITATGSQDVQNQATTYGYDWLNRLTSVEQHYTQNGGGFTSGTATLVQRTYDGYGQILTEQVSIDGTSMNQFSQSWDGTGRRKSLLSGLAPQGSGGGLITAYDYRADGLLEQARVARGYYNTRTSYGNALIIPTGESDPSIHNFAYNSAGLLSSRANPWRTQSITQRAAGGRILTQQNTLTVGGVTPLSESQTWNGRDTRSTYTANRTGDYVWNETRGYGYNARGQLYQETDSPVLGGTAANLYCFDNDVSVPTSGNGLGVRTTAMRQSNPTDYGNWQTGSFACDDPSLFSWVSQYGVDAFRRPVSEEQALALNSFYPFGSTYDNVGNTTWRNRWSANGTSNQQQYFTWDAQGRLVKALVQEGTYGTGYNWTAVYDGLGRRLRTNKQDLSYDSSLGTWSPTGTVQTIESYYDPLVEFLELGINLYTSASGTWTRTWKIFGPDLNGHYGTLQGIGGLEAVIDETTSAITPVINDAFGNIVGTIHTETTPFDEETGEGGITSMWMVWSDTRIGSYGVLPGSTAPVFDGANVALAQAAPWRGHRIDPTGLYYMGARYYDPVSGRFISPDPLGHAASMSLYNYCEDPVNGLDPDGRCAKGFTSGWSGSVSAGSPNTTAFQIGSLVGAMTSGWYSGEAQGAANVGIGTWNTAKGAVQTGWAFTGGAAVNVWNGNQTIYGELGNLAYNLATSADTRSNTWNSVTNYAAETFTNSDLFSQRVGGAGVVNLITVGAGSAVNSLRAGSAVTAGTRIGVAVGEDMSSAAGNTIWRHIPEAHPAIVDAQAGIVKPFGVTNDLSLDLRALGHDTGFTEGSGLTSWTTDLRWALQRQSQMGGVILETTAPEGSVWYNQAGKAVEAQVLVPGNVNGTIIR